MFNRCSAFFYRQQAVYEIVRSALLTFLTTLIVYSLKNREKYLCLFCISYKKRKIGLILKIFWFNDKNSLNLSLLFTLQFFEGTSPSRHIISRKIIWHTSNIKKSEFKSNKISGFSKTPFYFSFIFLGKTSHKFWDQPPSPCYQFCYNI